MKVRTLITIISALYTLYSAFSARAHGTAFTYQGHLNDSGRPANGTYDMRFAIYDSTNIPGNLIAGPLTNSATAVSNGLFTVTLDFGGGVFDGNSRWLDIAVRTSGSAGFTALTSRQPLTAAPCALFSEMAGAVPGLTLQQNSNGAPNIIAGSPGNYVVGGLIGATISGGGVTNYFGFSRYTNSVMGDFGTVGGGMENSAGIMATVAGGRANAASGGEATIAGGYSNYAPGEDATVAGGSGNAASGDHATVGGGSGNIASGYYSAVGGGYANTASESRSTIAGGYFNTANGVYDATVGGGSDNTASGAYATVAGGSGNIASGAGAFIGGGGYDSSTKATNRASGPAAVVCGGTHNTASGNRSAVGGGADNVASDDYATVGGGTANIASGAEATVAGGVRNTANGDYATTGGGRDNIAGASYTTVSGGTINTAANSYATVSGGYRNTASGSYSTLVGGYGNTASGPGSFVGGGGYDGNNIITNLASGPASVVCGGTQNTAGGNRATVSGGADNVATNWYATIPGGAWNIAGGQGSFAAGRAAKAIHDGAFVWNDDASGDLVSPAPNSVSMRASGGYRLFSGASSGVYLPPGGGSWTALSDRNAKENFLPVDASDVLEKVASLPLSTWNYKSQDVSIRHIGPMAQDFKAAFKVGETNTGITTVDEGGVALAAIQGLNRKLEQKETEISELRARLEKLEQLINAKDGGN